MSFETCGSSAAAGTVIATEEGVYCGGRQMNADKRPLLVFEPVSWILGPDALDLDHQRLSVSVSVVRSECIYQIRILLSPPQLQS